MHEAGEVSKLRPGTPPTRSRFKKSIDRIVGPRLIDLPIRVIALIDLASAFSPSTMESADPPYIALHFMAPLLGIAATVFPLASGIASASLFAAQLASYPEYLDGFQASIAFSAAVLLTHLRWRASLFLTAIAFVTTWAATVTHAPVEFATPYEILLYEWARNSVLALAAAALEFRFRRLVTQREAAARDHERDIQSQRVGFAVDAHDTVSQGLARQSRLIALLAKTNGCISRKEILGELSFTNDETQEQVRSYLSRLQHEGASPAPQSEFNLKHAVSALIETLHRAAEAGGLSLHIRQNIPPDSLPKGAFEQVQLAARELVTNMIKHSTVGAPCLLEMDIDRTAHAVTLVSSNSIENSPNDEFRTPRSLAIRAFDLGGSCEVAVKDCNYQVSLAFPVPTFPEIRDEIAGSE